MAQKRESGKLVAENRKARFNYTIEDKLEAGLVLTGSEVKSLRAGKANIADAYASDEGHDELYLINAHIAEYAQSGHANHEPTRPRKLLLHKRELAKFAGKASQKGFTLVPLRLYFKEGRAKVEIGVARGKQQHDKRQDQKKAEAQRDIRRAMTERRRH